MCSISEPKFTDPVVDKGPVGHDSNVNAKDNSTIRHSDVTPEFVYKCLFKTDKVYFRSSTVHFPQ